MNWRKRDPVLPAVLGTAIAAMLIFAGAFGLDPVLLSASVIVAAQPILLAATGEMVVEKSGVLNLGVEGMMILGAICGFAIAVETGSALFGMVAAAVSGAALSLIFGFLTQVLLTNQVATGLALTLFGLGFSALIGQPYSGVIPPKLAGVDLGFLSDLPVVGPLIFSHNLMIYFGLVLTIAIWLFLGRTRAGMILRAVGENPDAAHSLGYRVIGIRLAAIALGGACAGRGGAYLSLVRGLTWTEGMTAGVGWIALAIVVFGGWRPWRVMLGAYLFGGVTILQLNLQAARITPLWLLVLALLLLAVFYTVRQRRAADIARGPLLISLWLGTVIAGLVALEYPVAIQPQYLSMAPYIVTIIVLVVMSADRLRSNSDAPASLGRVFHKTA